MTGTVVVAKKRNPLPIMIFCAIILATIIGIGMYKKTSFDSNSAESEKEKLVDLAKIQRRLGPEWKKIEMVKNQWYGPFQMRNGTDWQIAEGEVWVKVDNERSFLDKPGTNPFVSGRQIKFLPATDTATLFFRY